MFNDSSFSIPTPMLGHGDVFHHTNLDTPDKCDPTAMKRIISLSLAATLLIANAEEEDALKIAREVFSQAGTRMAERTRKSLQLLHQYALNKDKRESLAELYSNLLNYPRIQATLESANIKEVKELCQEQANKRFIDSLAENLKEDVVREEEKIKLVYELLCRQYNLEKENFQPTDLYEIASSISPERLFKGPLPGGYLDENLSKEDSMWYQENREKAGGNFSSKTYEIVNLMDGKRNLLDIRHIVSCEYDETDVEFVLHFIEDLKKLGLVK